MTSFAPAKFGIQIRNTSFMVRHSANAYKRMLLGLLRLFDFLFGLTVPYFGRRLVGRYDSLRKLAYSVHAEDQQ